MISVIISGSCNPLPLLQLHLFITTRLEKKFSLNFLTDCSHFRVWPHTSRGPYCCTVITVVLRKWSPGRQHQHHLQLVRYTASQALPQTYRTRTPGIGTSRIRRSSGFPADSCQCRRCGFHSWVWKIPWRRRWQPTVVSGELQPRGSQRVRHDWWTEHPHMGRSSVCFKKSFRWFWCARVMPNVRIPEREEGRLPRQCNSQKKGSLIADSSQGSHRVSNAVVRGSESAEPKLLPSL